jgi:hypothetical protein
MSANRFRRIPQYVDAVQWTGDTACLAGVDWIHCHVGMVQRIDKGIELRLTDGQFVVFVGDWIMRDDDKNLTALSNNDFAAMYEPVNVFTMDT